MNEPNWSGVAFKLHMMDSISFLEFMDREFPELLPQATKKSDLVALAVEDMRRCWALPGLIGKSFVSRVVRELGIPCER